MTKVEELAEKAIESTESSALVIIAIRKMPNGLAHIEMAVAIDQTNHPGDEFIRKVIHDASHKPFTPVADKVLQ